MTYSSRLALICEGMGSLFLPDGEAPGVSLDLSSTRISLHIPMHSSQMFTPGPVTIRPTSSLDLPQNEHFTRPNDAPRFSRGVIARPWAHGKEPSPPTRR